MNRLRIFCEKLSTAPSCVQQLYTTISYYTTVTLYATKCIVVYSDNVVYVIFLPFWFVHWQNSLFFFLNRIAFFLTQINYSLLGFNGLQGCILPSMCHKAKVPGNQYCLCTTNELWTCLLRIPWESTRYTHEHDPKVSFVILTFSTCKHSTNSKIWKIQIQCIQIGVPSVQNLFNPFTWYIESWTTNISIFNL